MSKDKAFSLLHGYRRNVQRVIHRKGTPIILWLLSRRTPPLLLPRVGGVLCIYSPCAHVLLLNDGGFLAYLRVRPAKVAIK